MVFHSCASLRVLRGGRVEKSRPRLDRQVTGFPPDTEGISTGGTLGKPICPPGTLTSYRVAPFHGSGAWPPLRLWGNIQTSNWVPVPQREGENGDAIRRTTELRHQDCAATYHI